MKFTVLSSRPLVVLFFAALALRWSYSVILFSTMGDAALLGVDSTDYIHHAQQFAATVADAKVHGWQLLGLKPIMMPLYTWLLEANVLIAGKYGAFLYVLLQGFIDAGTCLLIYGMAQAVDTRFALPAGIAVAINPTQIVMAGMVYPDTPFVFFVALLLWSALRWLRSPSWPSALIIAGGLAGAAWFRILVAPFAPILAVILVLTMAVAGRYRRLHVLQLATAVMIFALSLVPISLRNFAVYGSFALTPQLGMHLARWVVPLVWEVNNGTPWATGYQKMERRAEELPHVVDENPFQQSRRYTTVAIPELLHAGLFGLAKAWAYGAAINLGSPAVLLSPPVASLPRTGFYATAGRSFFEKITNFMFHSDNRLYAWILLLGIAGTAIFRAAQLGGFVVMLRQGSVASTMLLITWCLFILAVNGPVASPKYRLPMEPALAVFTGAGWQLLRHRRGQTKPVQPRSQPV
jgi:4-amino-4-deoxy-L-arabinose transferase-like glycosyltransferase